MTATQCRSTDVFNIAVESKRRSAGFADKLGTPFLISNLATIGLAIVHDLDLLDRSIRSEASRVCDKFVFANNFIDDKPTTSVYSPDLLFVAQNAHSARLLNGFALRAR